MTRGRLWAWGLCCALGAWGLAGCDAASEREAAGPWQDDAEMAPFVDKLLARMTLPEKIGQLSLYTSDWDTTGPSMRAGYKEDIRAGKVGAVFNAYTADYTLELQRLAVEETRLGIPLLFGYDVIHGHRTIFPISLGEAASWDLPAIERSARIAATEAAAEGIHWTFAPMVDISRDPRWGRVSEGAGEDAYLGSAIARARVRGFQGDSLAALDTVLACAKHFAAYGQAQAGRDYHTTDMSQRELLETYLPPFKASVEAGVATFMTGFNDLNGVPVTASGELLQATLRDQWGFAGFVVSDYTSVNELVPHGFARDEKHAGELAMNAGLDMDMQGGVYQAQLQALVDEGKVTEAQIHRAAKRILQMKYRLGLFQDPYRYSSEARELAVRDKPEHLEAARDMARRSMVLLRNEGAVLPLDKSAGLTIALVGPLADSKADMIGSWAAAGDRAEKPVTLLEGIRAKVGEGAQILHAPGASYELGSDDQSGFALALQHAAQADLVIAAMGEKWDMSGEAASRTSLGLPGSQLALLKALKKLGKPIILALMSGRPMALEWESQNLPAILNAWYPGTMAGHAVADVLFGDYNPSGKLPMTFPRNVGQVPIHYNMKNTGRPYDPAGEEQKYRSRYLATPNPPLYPFGFGLSYTEFRYSGMALSSSQLSADGALTVSVQLQNTGAYDGEEVVQLYVQDLVGSVTRPVKELKGFRKLLLRQGETATVAFELTAADLAFHKRDLQFGAEAGAFKVFVGGSSADVLEASFTLLEDANF